jgi:phosphopantetheine--protein transferase-like protein
MSAATSELVEMTLTNLARTAVVPSAKHLGVDIVDIADFARCLDTSGPKLATRLFTNAELRFADGEHDRLAVTLAGKEAVSKVLGTGIRGTVRWKTIEVLRREDGAPFVLLHEGASERARQLGIAEIAISLCHESTLAVAVASAAPTSPKDR